MSETLIVGIGGAGTNIAREMAKRLHCRAASVNTDWSPKVNPSIEKVLIGEKVCRGSSAVVARRGRQAAEESEAQLLALIAPYAQVVLVAGLGGGTGTGAAPVLARLARANGIRVVCAVTLPFDFEAKCQDAAMTGLDDLEDEGFTVLVENNEEACRIRPKQPLSDVFETVTDNLTRKVGKYLRSVVDG